MRLLPAGQRKCRRLQNRCLPPSGNNLSDSEKTPFERKTVSDGTSYTLKRGVESQRPAGGFHGFRVCSRTDIIIEFYNFYPECIDWHQDAVSCMIGLPFHRLRFCRDGSCRKGIGKHDSPFRKNILDLKSALGFMMIKNRKGGR